MTPEGNGFFADNEKEILEEIRKEALENDSLRRRCRIVSFISTSRGRGRKRPSREVNLLVVDNNYAFQIIHGEIRPRKKSGRGQPDELAQEILSDVDLFERTADLLLQRLQQRNRFSG